MEGKKIGVSVGADRQYYKDFLEILKKRKLAMQELYNYQEKNEAPVIGRVMDKYNGFKKALILEKFAGFESETLPSKKGRGIRAYRLWIKTGSFDDDFKIIIGNDSKKLFISKEPTKEKITSYHVFDVPSKNGSDRLFYKNNFVDEYGRKVNDEGILIGKDDNVLVEKGGKFIQGYNENDIEWLIDIPGKWTEIEPEFLQKSYDLLGIKDQVK